VAGTPHDEPHSHAQVDFIAAVVLLQVRGRGAPGATRAWEGADGLEWEGPSPAPHHTYETLPRVHPQRAGPHA
jgi:cytochrome c oxidase subunit 1